MCIRICICVCIRANGIIRADAPVPAAARRRWVPSGGDCWCAAADSCSNHAAVLVERAAAEATRACIRVRHGVLLGVLRSRQ
jgi:hypothetical protein